MNVVRWQVALALVAGIVAAPATAAETAVECNARPGAVEYRHAGKTVATYVYEDREILRPYLTGLQTPGGIQVTRNHPPIEGRDATDHATMHPGLWLAFGDISGADFWRNKAIVKHMGFIEQPALDTRGAGFTVNNAYIAIDKTICNEVCRIRLEMHPAGYLITWDSRFSGPEEFYFGDQEELGLGFRVATPIAVKHGGRILNSDGLENEPQLWGKQADWCDYSGEIDGREVGLLLMPDPANFRRSWFHARDYGFLAANPFGVNAFTNGSQSKIVVRRGDTLRLRFGVLVHEGTVDLAAAYRDWVKRPPPGD